MRNLYKKLSDKINELSSLCWENFDELKGIFPDDFSTYLDDIAEDLEEEMKKPDHPILHVNAVMGPHPDDLWMDVNQELTEPDVMRRFLDAYTFWDGKKFISQNDMEDYSQWTFIYHPVHIPDFTPSPEEASEYLETANPLENFMNNSEELHRIMQSLKQFYEQCFTTQETDETQKEIEDLQYELQYKESYIKFLEERNKVYTDALKDIGRIVHQVTAAENYPPRYESRSRPKQEKQETFEEEIPKQPEQKPVSLSISFKDEQKKNVKDKRFSILMKESEYEALKQAQIESGARSLNDFICKILFWYLDNADEFNKLLGV